MSLSPSFYYAALADIPVQKLVQCGIKWVLLDFDNTLALWHTETLAPRAREWVGEAQAAGLTLFVFTNGVKENVDRVAAALGIDAIKDAKKPFKGKTRALLAQRNWKPEETVLIGDQLFTDILLANGVGAYSVLLRPLSKREWWCTKVFNRTREKLVWHFVFKHWKPVC